MININFRLYNPTKDIEKNNLYKITENSNIKFVEQHEESKEIVNVKYCFSDKQYGIYAKEYRSPSTLKEGCKTADVLACVVDENTKEIYSIVFDVKSNISAFSDELLKEGAMITAIKEVRDFIEQLHAEILHKKSFLLYYEDDGYVEKEEVGIVTKNFEAEKFRAVAGRLEEIVKDANTTVAQLVSYKLKNNLKPYMCEVKPLYDFADKKVTIREKKYNLNVFRLQKKEGENDYETTIQMVRDTHNCLCCQ